MRTPEFRFVFLGAMFSALAAVATAGDPIGTGFTYQGQLKRAGLPVTDTCDFEFSLWSGDNDPDPGIQIESTIPLTTQVGNGLFQVDLDFGSTAFNGDNRWLQVDVCCSSPCSPGFTMLSPRHKLTPTPYALQTRGLFVNDVGNVGIGTTDPQTPFALRAPTGTNDVGITQNLVGGTNTMEFTTSDALGNQATRILLRGDNDFPAIEFYSGARGVESQNMIITGSGNVGIGTTVPRNRLHVVNTLSGQLTYPLKVANEGNVDGTAVGMLFQVDGGGEPRGKGAIAYERTSSWNRGDFPILLLLHWNHQDNWQ